MDAADQAQLAELIALATDEGRRARRNGETPAKCPYDDPAMSQAWLVGYEDER